MGVVSCGTTMLDQGVFQNIGAVTWDTTVKTTGFTAVSGNGYFVNTTSGAFTVTLPSSPSAGDIVGIKDYANTADTNNITIGRNGSNIQGTANDFVIDTEGRSVILVYVDATKGWLVTSASQASDIELPAYVTATGGTVTCCGDYKIHTFTGPGTFTVTCAGNPLGSSTVDYLVVAGGASGGFVAAGGGGAGGYRESSGAASGCYTVSPLGACVSALPVSATGYPITVGGGGSAPSGQTVAGNNGSNSVFSTITSAGGGAGSGSSGPGAGTAASAGGSGGGGGGGVSNGPLATGGSGNTPPVAPPQGNNGGTTPVPGGGPAFGGSGGGGATVAGAAGGTANAGDGGDGATSSINGSPVTRAGGGGGSSDANVPSSGLGGSGGGGQGGIYTVRCAGAGGTNTGGGGGGSAFASPAGKAGGSGIVIIRYKFQ